MAGVSDLRGEMRATVFAAGGRGFVRFAAGGDALLLSDAPRRSDAQALCAALERAGFRCEVREGLLFANPTDERLLALCAAQPDGLEIDWESPRCEAEAFAVRLVRKPAQPLDDQGRRMILETARLLWQGEEKVLAGLPTLRARAAAMLREGKSSGLHEAGRLLCGYLTEMKNE